MLVSLGKSKIKIPPIGFGTGFNLDEMINVESFKRGLDFAVGSGLKLIDTAENYGNGFVEETIGEVIKNKRNSVVIASKFSPENSSSKRLIRACEDSLRRLKTDYIDIYQFHWPNPSVALEETLETLLLLKKNGKIRFIGASNFSYDELKISFESLKNNLISLQSEYNLLERTVEERGIYDYCKELNLSLIAYSPLDQGRLKSMNKKQQTLLSSLSKKYGVTRAQIILSWIIRDGFTVAIPRSLNKEHIKENMDSAEVKILPEDIKIISKVFASQIKLVSVEKIFISSKGERGNPVYQSLDEAIKNKFELTPSPFELSLKVKSGGFLKPVRLIKKRRSSKGTEYDLIGGRIRYWAWLLAFGKNRPIPASIRENIQ